MNRAEEDYIKTIYELTVEKNQPLIKSNDLVERFGYTDQSVNEMVKKLVTKHLVNFIPYKGISLTSKGKKVAIRMIRAHRIWEVFLTSKLGYSWESVHEDAEKLEHATSDEVIEKLFMFLGEPKFCQHGNPIPDLKGRMVLPETHALIEAGLNDTFELTRVLDVKELLIYLNEIKLKLYDQILILGKDDFNEIMRIKSKDQEISISFKIAKMLFGKII
ncbi:MAG: metal-dependent transcriptional regulator [Bacillota bacterium]|nr:MAG: metal-dependent transcriptional regulator [Bacillota bacterium]